MRKTYVDHLQPGMVLGKEILNDHGQVLLSRGVTLTPRYIEALKTLGFYAVYIQDGIADDVVPQDIISDGVRSAVTKHLRRLYSIAQNAPAVSPDPRQRSAVANLVGAAMPGIAQLYRDVEAIIDRAASAQVLSGITSLKSHDNYSFEHSVEVTVAAVLLGISMHLLPFELNQLALGCLCHDIGKLAIPREILQKPGPLGDEELALVRQHPATGYEIVRQLTGSSDILARHVVWQHHERQDGLGYPRGLRGTNEFASPGPGRFGQGLILPAAEIASVAEVYASLASDQPYRQALPPAQVAAVLREKAGSHLNREVVRRFLTILPVFPVGTEVVVIAGKLRGHRGVVTAVNPEDVQRPTVRIVLGPEGQEIPPFEVDTREDRDLQLAAMSYVDLPVGRPSLA
jgi:HD-GYP domain-containing protein (c-di-GMP phosphodiesterase class II)